MVLTLTLDTILCLDPNPNPTPNPTTPPTTIIITNHVLSGCNVHHTVTIIARMGGKS